jgi:hypothetical protein
VRAIRGPSSSALREGCISPSLRAGGVAPKASRGLGVSDVLPGREPLAEQMAAAVSLRGVNEPAMADAPAATPILGGHVGWDEQRLAPTPAAGAEEPPAAQWPPAVRYECEPWMHWRVPAPEHWPVARVEVREDVPHVEHPTRLDDVGVALGPLVETEGM